MTEELSPFDTLPPDQYYSLWHDLPGLTTQQRSISPQEVSDDLLPSTNTPSFTSDDWALSPAAPASTDNLLDIYALGMEDTIPVGDTPSVSMGLGIDSGVPSFDIEQELGLPYAFSPSGQSNEEKDNFLLQGQHMSTIVSAPSYHMSLNNRVSKRNCKGKTLKLPTPSFAEENEGAGSFLFLNFRKQSAWTRRKNRRK